MPDERKLSLTEQDLKRAASEYAAARVPRSPRRAVADFYFAILIEVETQLMEVRHALIEGNPALRALDIIDHAKTHRIPDHLDLTAQLKRAHGELQRTEEAQRGPAATD